MGKYKKFVVAVKYRLGFGEKQLRKMRSRKLPQWSVVVVATRVFVTKRGMSSQSQKRMELTLAIKACRKAASPTVCAMTCRFRRSAAGTGASVGTGLANSRFKERAVRACNGTGSGGFGLIGRTPDSSGGGGFTITCRSLSMTELGTFSRMISSGSTSQI